MKPSRDGNKRRGKGRYLVPKVEKAETKPDSSPAARCRERERRRSEASQPRPRAAAVQVRCRNTMRIARLNLASSFWPRLPL